jgi:hypothetical protein
MRVRPRRILKTGTAVYSRPWETRDGLRNPRANAEFESANPCLIRVLPVPRRQDAQDVKFEDASSSLSEGLETCREVVANYRRLLVGNSQVFGEGRLVADNDASAITHRQASSSYLKPAQFWRWGQSSGNFSLAGAGASCPLSTHFGHE